ncbi:MAG: competence/damage-inducible protein A [Myxococcales bacterium]|nr:competence/damage-inducible protein A [Myxococcales bacterium]
MDVALLSIGTELLHGEIANTNAQWLGQRLTQLGIHVAVVETVGDDRPVLTETLSRLAARYPLVIATGGLGPTTDDLTAEVVAEIAGVPLVLDLDAFAAIARKLAALGRELRPSHEKQARLPKYSEPLPNTVGTAAGFSIEHGQNVSFFLPGVPREMTAMFDQFVVPRLDVLARPDTHVIVLHTHGAPESELGELLVDLERAHAGVTVGYRLTGATVDVKLIARAADRLAARNLAEAAASEARDRLGERVFAEGDDSIVEAAVRALRARGWTLAVAESCTGGLLAQQLTRMPASDYFIGGTVAYANSAKTRVLGVSEDTLRGHGAVSGEVAAELAEGARRAFACDVALAITGIAGPTGGSSDKPVGLCHWACAHPGGTVVEQQVFRGTRTQVQERAAHAVLDLLRRVCAGDR